MATVNKIQKSDGTAVPHLIDSQILDDGTNVGVGTTSPGSKLDVAGSGAFSGPVKIGATSFLGNENLKVQNDADGYQLVVQRNNSGKLSSIGIIADNSNAVTMVAQGGSARGGTDSNATLIDNLGSGQNGINFRLNGTCKMRLDSGGKVGIGTTTPQEALQVNGNIRIDDGTGYPGLKRVWATEKVFNVLDYGAVPLQPIVNGSNSAGGGTINETNGTLTDSGQFANVQAGGVVNILNGMNASGVITKFLYNLGPNTTTVTTTAQPSGLQINDLVLIAGTQNFNGVYQINNVTSTSFDIPGGSSSYTDSAGSWTRTNSGSFVAQNPTSDSITVGSPQYPYPKFLANQSGVKWQINACGTNGTVSGSTLSENYPGFNNVSVGDTLWITSGPNTGYYSISAVNKSNPTSTLSVTPAFSTAQSGVVCWLVTKGSLALADNTSAFQAAIDAAAAVGGGVVFVPDGYYYFNNTQTLIIRSNVILRGKWNSSHFWRNDLWQAAVMQGPVLLPTGNSGGLTGNPVIAPQFDSAVPFITLAGDSGSCGIEGLTIFYPCQYLSSPNTMGDTTNTIYNVVMYPYCIDVQSTTTGIGCDHTVMNMQLVNPYQGIRMEAGTPQAPGGGSGSGRNRICNVYGSPLFMGLSINSINDVSYVEKVFFTPNFVIMYDRGSGRGDAYQPVFGDWNTYFVKYVTGLQIRNTVWLVLQDIFGILLNCGIRIIEDAVSTLEASIFGCNIQFDQMDIGIHVKLLNSGSYLNAEFTNVRLTAYQAKTVVPPVVHDPTHTYQYKKCVYGDAASSSLATGVFMLNTGALCVFGGGVGGVIDWQIPSSSVALAVSNMRFDAVAPGSTVGLTAGYGRIQLHGCVFNAGAFTSGCFSLQSPVAAGIIYGNDYCGNPAGTNAAANQCFNVGGAVGIGQTAPASGLHIGANAGGTGKGFLTLEDITTAPGAPGTSKAVIYLRSGALRAKFGTSNTEKTFTVT